MATQQNFDVSQLLFEQFCRTAGLKADVPAEKVGLRKAIEIARGGQANPCAIEFAECRIEHFGPPVEGAAVGRGPLSEFHPFGTAPEYWAAGSEGRLRYPGGSIRILVLGHLNNELLFARAPARRERRKFGRASAQGVALVRMGDAVDRLDLHDVSEGGLALEGAYAVEVGETLKLLLRLEGKGSLPLECEGIVRSCRTVRSIGMQQCRVGIEFTKVSDALMFEIRNHLRHLTE